MSILYVEEMQKEINEIAEENAILEQQVFILDGHIVIAVNVNCEGSEYNIELARCNTPEKILGWVFHLTKKTWMTKVILIRFIEVACQAHSIKIMPV